MPDRGELVAMVSMDLSKAFDVPITSCQAQGLHMAKTWKAVPFLKIAYQTGLSW